MHRQTHSARPPSSRIDQPLPHTVSRKPQTGQRARTRVCAPLTLVDEPVLRRLLDPTHHPPAALALVPLLLLLLLLLLRLLVPALSALLVVAVASGLLVVAVLVACLRAAAGLVAVAVGALVIVLVAVAASALLVPAAVASALLVLVPALLEVGGEVLGFGEEVRHACCGAVELWSYSGNGRGRFGEE